MGYDDIVEKIIKEKGLGKEEVESKIRKKLDLLSDLVSKDGAAHIIAHELGVKVFEDIKQKEFKVKNVIAGLTSVDLTGKIVTIYGVKEFKTEKRSGRVANFVIGDETGTMRVVLWEDKLIDQVPKLKEGDVIKISNAYSKDNSGFKELHLGGRSNFLVVDGIDINVKEVSAVSSKKLNELKEGDRVEVDGTIVQIFEPRFYAACSECNKKVSLEEDKYKCSEHGIVAEKYLPVVNFIFDDGTDNIRVVFFRDAAERLMRMSSADLTKIKDDPSEFEKVKSDILGKQLKVFGRVVKNDMFDRLEFIGDSFEELNAVDVAEELLEDLG